MPGDHFLAPADTGAGVSGPVAQALDRLTAPVLVLGLDGTVLYANAAAMRLTPRDAAWIDAGRLRTHGVADLGALRAVGEVALRAPTGPPSLALSAPIGEGKRVVRLVCVGQPALATLAQPVIGLTRAESEIAAALIAGLRPREIAAMRGRSLHTVRSQIRAIHAKADVRRQSDMLRLAGAPGGLVEAQDIGA